MLPYDLKWKQIESKHFTVVYHINDQIAFKTINIAENIHYALHNKFRIPDNIHTYIVIVDSSDIANGMATVLPANIIFLYYTGVEINTEPSILNTYQWWKLLILHEYIHILHFNQRKDINKLLNFIGLKYIILNPFLPAFCIEGVAVCFETEYTRMGRARSLFTDMVLRTAVYENSVPSLDEIAFWNVKKILPGQGAYIWGGAFNEYLLNEYSEDDLLKLYYTHSGCVNCCMGYTKNSCLSLLTLSPLNGISKDVFGAELYDIWKHWVYKIKQKYRKKIKEIQSKGITAIKKISGLYYNIYNLTSKKGKIIFSAYSPHKGYGIYKIENNKDKIIVKNRFVNSLVWLNQTLYFTGYEYFKNYYTFFELFKISSEKISQITIKGRILAIFKYNKNHFIAIKNTANNKQIILCDKNGKSIKVLAKFKKESIIGDIGYIKEENTIYFILKQENDFVDIFKLNLNNKKIERITNNPAIEISLFVDADKKGFYFISDFDGIYNLYFYSIKEKKFYKKTNLVRGIFKIYKVKEKLYTVVYSSFGYYIGKILGPLINEEINYNANKNYPNYVEDDKIDLKSYHASAPQPYSPFENMPSTILYFPSFTVNNDFKKYVFIIDLYLSDILFYHIFFINLTYDYFTKDFNFKCNYYNYSFNPNFKVTVYKNYSSDGGSLLFQFLKLKWHYYLTFLSGIEIERENRKDYYNSLSVAVSYNSTEKYPYSITMEQGFYSSIKFNLYDKILGSKENFHTMEISTSKFFPFIFLHHTLQLDFKGGFLLNKSDYKPYKIISSYFNNFPPIHKYMLTGYFQLCKTGKNYLSAKISYSLPLIWIEQGYKLFPFMLEKLWFKFYYNAVEVFDKIPVIENIYDNIGTEFLSTIKMFYSIKTDIGVGISKGLKNGGKFVIYLTIKIGF